MDTPDPIPISALQHWSYCPRQCALIHAEQVFADNVHTARGHAVHALVDEPGCESRRGVRVERGMPLWSDRLGLIGKADVVEFGNDGTPFPVEYKHGPRRRQRHDEIQLAAQALCLEEMTGREVPAGALFQYESRRRRLVAIDSDLRQSVVDAIAGVRLILRAPQLPPPVNDARCRQCSLLDLCQPAQVADKGRIRSMLFELTRP